MLISGIDCSSSSPGVTIMDLDENYKIKSFNFLSFTSNMKSNFDFIKSYGQFKFSNNYQRYDYLTNEIIKFLDNCEYMAFEEYSFGSFGGSSAVTAVAEIAGYLKLRLMQFNIKLRHYAVKHIKKFATGCGGNDKTTMYKAYLKHHKASLFSFLNIDVTKVNRKNELLLNSPFDDIFDSFWICEMLRCELAIKNNCMSLDDLKDYQRDCFIYKVSKSKTKRELLENPKPKTKSIIKNTIIKPFDSIKD